MAHSHTHSHGHSHDTARKIGAAFFLNLAFTILEIIGGLWTNSLAILSDSLHDLGDSFALGLSWYLEKYSKRGMDKRYSYGYQRFSLLGGVINAVVLIVGSLFILSEAIPRLLHPEEPNAPGMVAFAIIGVAVNGIAALQLRGGRSINAQVVAWHLLEDVLGWAAVLVVSIVLLFKDIYILDPGLSILITLYVLYNVVRNLRKTAAIFLQVVPSHFDIDAIEDHLLSLERVQSVHHTHLWSLDGEHHVLSTHVVVDEDTTREQASQIKQRLRELVDDSHIEHTTVEIEYESDPCHEGMNS